MCLAQVSSLYFSAYKGTLETEDSVSRKMLKLLGLYTVLSLGLLGLAVGCSSPREQAIVGGTSDMRSSPRTLAESRSQSEAHAQQELANQRDLQSYRENIGRLGTFGTFPGAEDPGSTLVAQSSVVDFIRNLDGQATLLGVDGAFLGIISSDRVHEASTCNAVGNYGSRVGSMSVWNRVSNYGSQISDLSAYHTWTKTPPAIIYQDEVMGFLTKNHRIRAALDPDVLFAVLCGR